MSKRLITENWYKFLNEMNYHDDQEEWVMERHAEKALELLRTQKAQIDESIQELQFQKAQIEERIEELETQMAASAHSVSQIKEDKDG